MLLNDIVNKLCLLNALQFILLDI